MKLSEGDIDALGEIVNIGVGRAACSLSELIGTRIDLRVPVVRTVDCQLADQQTEAGMSIMQSFEGEVSGNALLVFPTESGKKLAGLLAGYNSSEEIPELEISGILSEVGNIVLNGVLGSLANVIESDLTYTVPDFYVQETITSLMNKRNDQSADTTSSILIADTEFCVESQDIRGSVVVAFHLGSFVSLLERLAVLQN
ncbi:MAG: chemotaxis protein CheC [Planctomycetota bacterium]